MTVKLQPEAIIEAFQKAAQSYGVKALAAEMDKAPSTLYSELNPWGDRSKSKLGLEDAVKIAGLTGDISGLRLALDILGYSVAPKNAKPNRESPAEELGEDAVDFGIFAEKIMSAASYKDAVKAANALIDNIYQTLEAKRQEGAGSC